MASVFYHFRVFLFTYLVVFICGLIILSPFIAWYLFKKLGRRPTATIYTFAMDHPYHPTNV